MAALTPSYQDFLDFRSGQFLCVTKVVYSGAADTVALPEGLISANHVKVMTVDPLDTAPSVTSITQLDHPQGATLTLATGGTTGAILFIMSLHCGNAAGL